MAAKVTEVSEKTSLLTKTVGDEETGTFPVVRKPPPSGGNTKWTPWVFVSAALIALGLISVGILGLVGVWSNGDDDDGGDDGGDDGDDGDEADVEKRACSTTVIRACRCSWCRSATPASQTLTCSGMALRSFTL
eukprot:928825-Prorocentrum_minimum.AAC.3